MPWNHLPFIYLGTAVNVSNAEFQQCKTNITARDTRQGFTDYPRPDWNPGSQQTLKPQVQPTAHQIKENRCPWLEAKQDYLQSGSHTVSL